MDTKQDTGQLLPTVQDSLAYRSAASDRVIITGLWVTIGWFLTGFVAGRLLHNPPEYFEPFLDLGGGYHLYTMATVIAAAVKFHDNKSVVSVCYAMSGVLFVFLVIGSVLGAKKAQKARDRLLKSSAHGSAYWATLDDIKAAGLLPEKSSPNTCYVGGYLDRDSKLHYLQHAGPEHVIAFAPTRSGKGVGLVVPTLLAWRGSAVVHDIKGENWALTAGYRQSIGQRCLKFAPTLNDGSSCKFNPLNEIRVGTDSEVSDTQNIATMIVDPDGKGLNDHWAKTGFALLVGTILHVLYSSEISEKTLRSVGNLLSDPAVASVDDVFGAMKTYQHDKTGARGWRDLSGKPTRTHPVVAQSAQEMLNKADNEKSGVISTAMSFLSLYRDPVVAENVSKSDFRIVDLMGDNKGESIAPTSLYLVVPPSDKDRLKPLIRLVLNQIVRRLTESMEFKNGRSVDGFQHRLLLMIDEFPSLGRLDIFAESLAYVAGYGMKMYLICQDTAQLYKEYTKDETIIANCHIRVVYAPNRLETAQWLSKILGKQTLVTENTTFSYNGQFMPYQTGMSGGLQYQGRELLTAEEVMALRGPTKDASGNITTPGAMITLIAGKPPIFGTQMLYFKDPIFFRRASIEPPDARIRAIATAAQSAPVIEIPPEAEPTVALAQCAQVEVVQESPSFSDLSLESLEDLSPVQADAVVPDWGDEPTGGVVGAATTGFGETDADAAIAEAIGVAEAFAVSADKLVDAVGSKKAATIRDRLDVRTSMRGMLG